MKFSTTFATFLLAACSSSSSKLKAVEEGRKTCDKLQSDVSSISFESTNDLPSEAAATDGVKPPDVECVLSFQNEIQDERKPTDINIISSFPDNKESGNTVRSPLLEENLRTVT